MIDEMDSDGGGESNDNNDVEQIMEGDEENDSSIDEDNDESEDDDNDVSDSESVDMADQIIDEIEEHLN